MNVLDHVKEIAELVKKYNDQDLYARIIELREEMLQLREENLSLREQLKSLRQSTAIQKQLRRDGNCYYLDDDKEKCRPYCLACWDADKKLVSLIMRRDRSGRHLLRCSICNARKSS